MSLKTIEDAIITKLKEAFGNKIKAVDSIGRNFDQSTSGRVNITAPGVYVAFAGGQASQLGRGGLDTVWGVFAVGANTGGEKQGRRGNAHQIGAYEILQTSVQVLDQCTIADQGTLKLRRVQNLSSDALNKSGLTVLAAMFEMPVNFGTGFDPANLDDFATFNADWDLATPDGTIDAQDQVSLPTTNDAIPI